MLSTDIRLKIARYVALYGRTANRYKKSDCIRFVGANIEDEIFDKRGILKVSSGLVYDFTSELYDMIYKD